MPNWCRNDVTISHEDPAMIQRMANAKDKVLQEFYPCPQELLDTVSPAPADVAKANIEKYGAPDWYDWCVNNWGTKWDIGFDDLDVMEDGKTLTASFCSAWSPPIGAYHKLKELGFVINAFYVETGVGFAGEWDDGDDFCFEYDFTDDDWADKIPDTLADYLQGEYECWLEYNSEEEANV